MLSIAGFAAAIAAERSGAAPIRDGDGHSGAVQRCGWRDHYCGGAWRCGAGSELDFRAATLKPSKFRKCPHLIRESEGIFIFYYLLKAPLEVKNPSACCSPHLLGSDTPTTLRHRRAPPLPPCPGARCKSATLLSLCRPRHLA